MNVTPKSWHRFNTYASRVRFISWNDSVEFYNYDFVARLLLSKPRSVSNIFPKLQNLHISLPMSPSTSHSPLASSLNFAATVLSSSISSIALSLGTPSSDENLRDLVSFVTNLSAYWPNVKALSCSGDFIKQLHLPDCMEPACGALGGWTNLKEATFGTLDMKTCQLVTLAALPKLSQLKCFLSFSTITSARSRLDFFSLTTMDIGLKSMKTAGLLLQSIGFAQLQQVKMNIIGSGAQPDEISSLATGISKFCGTLEVLQLRCELLAYKSLLSLSKCTRLKSIDCPIACDTDDIDHLSLHFPNLENLHLYRSSLAFDAAVAEKLDLSCLELLALRCQRLKRIWLGLNPNRQIPKNWDSNRFQVLSEITIDYAEVTFPSSLAIFLSSISATTLRVSGPPPPIFANTKTANNNAQTWAEIGRLVPLLQLARRDEKKNTGWFWMLKE